MAKIEHTKMTVTLDNDSKRVIRDLTKAIDRLRRNMMPFKVEDGVTRLMEPAQDTGDEDTIVPKRDLRTEEYPTYQKYTALG